MPTQKQVNDHVNRLGRLDVEDIKRRLDSAIRRDKGRAAVRDGFAASSVGGGGGNILHCFEHERDNCPCGKNELIPVASDPTGNAAAGAGVVHDELHEHLEHAIGYLDQAVMSVNALEARLNAIDRLTDASDLNPPAGCDAMARVGVWEAVHRTTSINGVPWKLGGWAYRFLVSNDRLPTTQECERHARGERVYVTAPRS